MSNDQGTESAGLVDYAELVVQTRPLQKTLEEQLNARNFDAALETALHLKMLMTRLYWHLCERPHLAIHYDACFNETQTACR